MAEHTPGPWKYFRSANGSFGVDARDADICETLDRDAVAEANARLIAAAPEMLEALEAVWEEVRPYAKAQPYSVDSFLPDPFKDKIQAAIRKARGER